MNNQLNIVQCPNCNQYIIIEQLNCCIFRCGVFKSNYEQINPHLGKKECDQLARERLIYGCGYPFKIVDSKAVKCDYI